MPLALFVPFYHCHLSVSAGLFRSLPHHIPFNFILDWLNGPWFFTRKLNKPMFLLLASRLYFFCATDLYQLVLGRQKLEGHTDENTWICIAWDVPQKCSSITFIITLGSLVSASLIKDKRIFRYIHWNFTLNLERGISSDADSVFFFKKRTYSVNINTSQKAPLLLWWLSFPYVFGVEWNVHSNSIPNTAGKKLQF